MMTKELLLNLNGGNVLYIKEELEIIEITIGVPKGWIAEEPSYSGTLTESQRRELSNFLDRHE